MVQAALGRASEVAGLLASWAWGCSSVVWCSSADTWANVYSREGADGRPMQGLRASVAA
ncbi:hypothetical protein I79_000926 [Cricetulus griseus]|uniref:Uncharacterized protein n=1 Tax=Cricetulus griseus TaxID=10029 RepID=G3GTE6_CRIGR|nr:hypothetical protein I79_000926 [Cricetulus griseus]